MRAAAVAACGEQVEIRPRARAGRA